METIQSRHNPLFKHLHKLATQRRERLKSRQTLLDGPHLLASALDAGWVPGRLLATPQGMASPEIAALIRRAGSPLTLIDPTLFADLSELPSPTGVLALTDWPASKTPRRDGFCLLLDGVQDPGNVGTILRTAAAAGVMQVLLSPGCADVWSPKVLRSGMGAHFLLDIVERADLPAFADDFQGVIAATLLDGAIDLHAASLTGDLALAVGAEGQGVTPELAARARLRLRIPMAPGVESLNVGAAAAICLYERVRQLGGMFPPRA
ncbi:TrmH family RNA methyltransferase [Chitiniphilus eburneus]|uniref:RNA methyltransferase n=1 Tax=Chitiniphilus eburneus TaxID=2571148 RepID=A0A4U0Q526_9NEIS|nr:RNA methyltransferase [Chitiniphilus eburneus]TJZ76165.1 RNA methyltransferase [Chitiniphilus eburneus]